MKVVATMMVRDEVDIVGAMIEHHLAQGVDHLIVTDNASVDGTTEVLEAYAQAGVLELHHDPEHRKQQHSVVTGMARRARTHFGADWVINADADEFFVPVDREMTLREVLSETPLALGAFTAEVRNLVGPPSAAGSGLTRLRWRDVRPDDDLRAAGVFAHPTPNAIHRGDPSVTVAQGNHFVSLESQGQPPAALAIEVLHLPWRSWAQLERKVVNAGRAYESNPDLRPSPNHHGMADYRRYRSGRLLHSYLARVPPEEVLEADTGFELDPWLGAHLAGLVPTAVRSAALAAALEDDAADLVDPAEHREKAVLGRAFVELEAENVAHVQRELAWRRQVSRLGQENRVLRRKLRRLQKQQGQKPGRKQQRATNDAAELAARGSDAAARVAEN